MIVIADRNGTVDSVYHTLIKHIKSELPIVVVSWAENFVFNDALLEIKEYVLCCFCEYGWDVTLVDSHLWGINSERFPRYYTGDWVKFDNWVKENKPKLFFKRELLKEDVSEKILPIEYPALHKFDIQSKHGFDSRPLSVFMYWGRSSENRVHLHGSIWKESSRLGYSIGDNVYYINGFLNEESGVKWFTANIPHYVRHPIENILQINSLSKLSVSPGGAGNKCFRHMESPVNSIMAMESNDIAWTFDWVHGINCLKYTSYVNAVEQIDGFAKRSDLHEIYAAGVENCNRYHTSNYIPYIESVINKHS